MESYNYLSFKPVGYSYRVAENIWAGEYPVHEWDEGGRRSQLRLFLDFGITDFLDLTEYGEMPPYADFLPAGVRRHTFPILNGGTPESPESVAELFRKLEQLFSEHPDSHLYIHCHGGIGRTGTIVACYYIWFERLDFEGAVAKMRGRFKFHGGSRWANAPENQNQMDFIRNFHGHYEHR